MLLASLAAIDSRLLGWNVRMEPSDAPGPLPTKSTQAKAPHSSTTMLAKNCVNAYPFYFVHPPSIVDLQSLPPRFIS